MAFNLFGSGREVKQLKQQVAALSARVSLSAGLKFINESIALYPEWGVVDYINAYTNTDQVFSVVNLICETSLSVPRFVYIQKKDQESKRAFYKLTKACSATSYNTKALVDIKRMQTKALEDAPENDPLLELLKNPNYKHSENEFVLACLIFYQLKECFIYKNRIPEGGGANEGKVTELIPIPPQNVILRVTREVPMRVVGYDIIVAGRTIYENVPLEDMIHWKRFNPCSWGVVGEDLRGLSPLQPLKRVIARLEAEDNVTTAQLQNGGLPGIIFDDIGVEHMNKDTQDVLDLKRQRFYAWLRDDENKGAPWMTGGKLGYIQTGLKLADMLVAELGKADFKRICNAYKVSDILFNNNDASTESNVEIQTKRLYTNACLPLLFAFYTALMNGLKDDFPDQKRVILPDGSAIPELQADFAKLAQQFSNMPGGFTMNELRDAFGWDKSEDALCDKIIVKQGYLFIEDIQGELPMEIEI